MYAYNRVLVFKAVDLQGHTITCLTLLPSAKKQIVKEASTPAACRAPHSASSSRSCTTKVHGGQPWVPQRLQNILRLTLVIHLQFSVFNLHPFYHLEQETYEMQQTDERFDTVNSHGNERCFGHAFVRVTGV